MDVELRDTIEKEVHSAVQSTQNQLLSSLTSLPDARLYGVQRNIQEKQKALSESQMVKIDENMTNTFKFKKREKEEQCICNEKGHWRRECPKQTVEHRNKISSFTFMSRIEHT